MVLKHQFRFRFGLENLSLLRAHLANPECEYWLQKPGASLSDEKAPRVSRASPSGLFQPAASLAAFSLNIPYSRFARWALNRRLNRCVIKSTSVISLGLLSFFCLPPSAFGFDANKAAVQIQLASNIKSNLPTENTSGIVSRTGQEYLKNAIKLYQSELYFKSARYAFAAGNEDPALNAEAYAQMTLSLLGAGLPNAASYFFIRTLQSENSRAIRLVLVRSQDLFLKLGPDLFRKYLIRHTRYEDYDEINQSAYLYSLGKEAVLDGEQERAIGYLKAMSPKSPLWPYSLQLRGTAAAILGKNQDAIESFQKCISSLGSEKEEGDLRARCLAGLARTYYQMNDFDRADHAYSQISKKSLIWPDILFEQAWNSFSKQEFNQTLGKLVSYKSPSLEFLFNAEIDVLRAQAYLGLCRYSDANTVIDEFNSKYSGIGVSVKDFVEKNEKNLPVFYSIGKVVLKNSIYNKNNFYRLMNRFVRAPYFKNLVANEQALSRENQSIRQYMATQSGGNLHIGEGLSEFLEQVLNWRAGSIRSLGGAYVKNSLIDYHTQLIDDFDKIAFVKIELLKSAKEKLTVPTRGSAALGARESQDPSRYDYQYKWSFNGEFWNDELGDYVFDLKSECKG